MRLARLRVESPDGPDFRIAVAGDEATDPWIDLRAAARHELVADGATSVAARAVASALVPSSMSETLARGEATMALARRAIAAPRADTVVADPDFANALDPVRYRDFMVFEKHFSFGYEWRGLPVPEVMYEFPVSYAGEPRSFLGPGDEVPWPAYTDRLDYELELGIVIGTQGTGLTPEGALDHVAGLIILNDVSARDIQGREMASGLGPSKGKHFGSIVGPWITTLDALPDGLRMRARVNGETWCDASSDEMVWSVAEIVAWASQGEQLEPGTLLGSGTCNGGSTIEIDRRLESGDVLEFEVEGLGVLRNVVGPRATGGWTPETRLRDAAGKAEKLHFLW